MCSREQCIRESAAAPHGLIELPRGTLMPPPCVLERWICAAAWCPSFAWEKHVVILIGLEWRIEVDEIHRAVRDVPPKHVQVIAIVQLVEHGPECAPGARIRRGERRQPRAARTRVARVAAWPGAAASGQVEYPAPLSRDCLLAHCVSGHRVGHGAGDRGYCPVSGARAGVIPSVIPSRR